MKRWFAITLTTALVTVLAVCSMAQVQETVVQGPAEMLRRPGEGGMPMINPEEVVKVQDWFTCDLPRQEIRKLMTRDDWHAWLSVAG